MASQLKVFGFPEQAANEVDNTASPAVVDDDAFVHANGRVICLKCNKSLKTMNIAKSHYMEQHLTDKSEKKFQCEVCKQEFAIRRYLADHMTKHHGISRKMMKTRITPKRVEIKEKDVKELNVEVEED